MAIGQTKLSSYPHGFRNGVSIKGMPVLNVHSSNVVWVDSNTSGDKGTFEFPKSTLDAAVAFAKANKATKIMIKAGHAETLIADSAVDLDVAGIQVIGLGTGEDRPTFTFTTATAADFKIAAANVAVANCIFKCNIASQVMMIEVTGKDSIIDNCEFREGTATGLNFITYGVADNDSDRFTLSNCKFHMPTAGNGDSAVNIAKDMIGGRIINCEIYGDFDEAGIDVPAGGNAQVDLQIQDCVITNLLTGQHAIQINGTSSTGKIINTYVQTDAQATSVDAGGLECFNVLFHIGTDQTEAVPALPSIDSTGNVLGADNNNNAFASTNVVTNVDGSVLERLEHLARHPGVQYMGKCNVLGSAIPNNAQTAAFMTADATATIVIDEIFIVMDSTGWATPTNIEITTNNIYGPTGAASPIVLEPIASFGARLVFRNSEGTTNRLPVSLEGGKSLFIHGDDAAGTGAGTGLVFVKYRMLDTGQFPTFTNIS